MCKSCKIFFPVRHMLEKHTKSVHKIGSPSATRKRKPSFFERMKEKAAGYHKMEYSNKYGCNYCLYLTFDKSAMERHVKRRHSDKKQSVAVKTPSVMVVIESANEINDMQEEKLEETKLEPKVMVVKQSIRNEADLIEGDMEMIEAEGVISDVLEEESMNIEVNVEDPISIENEVFQIDNEEQISAENLEIIENNPLLQVENEELIQDVNEELVQHEVFVQNEELVQAEDIEFLHVDCEEVIAADNEVLIQADNEVLIQAENENFAAESQDLADEENILTEQFVEELSSDVWTEEDATRKGELYTCPYCNYDGNTRTAVHNHIQKCHYDEWIAAIARKDRRRKPYKKPAFQYGPKVRSFPCEYCDYAATNKPNLNSHMKHKHPEIEREQRTKQTTEFQCDQCEFKTTERRKIQIHIERKHVTENRYPCEYCGKKFKVKCDLTSHIRFQHLRVPCVCDVCGKICTNSNALHVHQKREHYKPEFECQICKRRMVSQENLDEHIQRQHEQRIKYMCEQCGKVFDQPNKLKQHSMTHTGERPHICHLCGKAFARRAVFRQHLLIHTGQKPYTCDICGKSFTQKPGLICHRKMHPGEKPPLPVVYIDHILDKFVQK